MPLKSALLRLMDQVAGAGSLEAVYREALQGLQATLDVERASVLVFDADRVMRFVAWSNLSPEYRAAVEGHSPWPPDATDAEPILVPDVLEEPSLREYAPLFEREGIRALGFIPLRFGPKLLGKFMLYYAEPHAFSTDEVTVAQTIAGHVAFALEHLRIADALEARLAAEQLLRERAEDEAALRQENERRLHLALEAGHMGTWEWDVASGRVEWSPQLEAIHGLAPGTFGGSYEDFRRDVHPADLDRVERTVAAALERPDDVYELDYRVITPDGTTRWLTTRGRVLQGGNGKPARMIGICSDTTERKRAEDANAFVAEASRILATTLDPARTLKNLVRIVVPRLADCCIVRVLDDEGRLTPVEVAHRDRARKELLWALARRWPPPPDAPGGVAEVLRTGRPQLFARIDRSVLEQHALDAQHVHALDTLELHSAITVPLKAHGRVLGAISLLSTDSLRVYGEADMELAEEIASFAALAIDNAQLYAQARSAIDARDDMIAAVSHDLRNPLQSISAAATLLRLDVTPEQRARSLRSIVLASEQMHRLVNDLLDISRLDAGKLHVDKRPVDVVSVVHEAQALFQPQAEAKTVQMQIAIADELPPVAGDRGRILQVLGNLLGNAFKFAPAGGKVTIAAESRAGEVTLSVADDGIGIPEDDQAKVFDRFWRGDHSQPRGAGLGLAVAKGIVEAHGGTIGVRSRVGEGSVFYFSLPAHLEQSDGQSADTAVPLNPGSAA